MNENTLEVGILPRISIECQWMSATAIKRDLPHRSAIPVTASLTTQHVISWSYFQPKFGQAIAHTIRTCAPRRGDSAIQEAEDEPDPEAPGNSL